MENNQGEASLSKKVMFSYFPNEKRPGNVGIWKRWEVEITNNLEKCNVKNWRRETKDRGLWRETNKCQSENYTYEPKDQTNCARL